MSSGVAQRVGGDSVAGGWNHPKPPSITHLVSMLAAAGTSAGIVGCGLSTWPLRGFLASSQHGGWVLRVSVLGEQGRRAWHF